MLPLCEESEARHLCAESRLCVKWKELCAGSNHNRQLQVESKQFASRQLQKVKRKQGVQMVKRKQGAFREPAEGQEQATCEQRSD